MTTAPQPSKARRRALLLTVLVALVALLFGTVTASAAALPAAETRVGAIAPGVCRIVGVHERITAGQRSVRGPSQLQVVSGHGVADNPAGSKTGSDGKTVGAPRTGTWNYCYDRAGRLNTFTDTDPNANDAARNRLVTYDADGNRLGYGPARDVTRASGGTPARCAATTSSTAPTTDTVCQTYNADDSLATRTDPEGGTRTAVYDAAGRQVEDGCTATRYDGFDRQRSIATLDGGQPSYGCGTRTTSTVRQQQAPGFCTVPGCPTDIYAQTVRDTTTTSSTTYGYDALDRRRDRATTSNASTSTTTTYTDSTGTPLAPTLGLPPLPAATSTRGTTTSSTGTEYDGSTSNELQQYDDSATTTRPAIGPSTRATSSSTLTYTLGGDGAPLAEFGTTATTSTDPTAPPSANSSTDSAGWLSTDGHGTVATVSNYAGQTLCAARFDPYGTPERQKYTDNVSYLNPGGQVVNPLTGETLQPSDPLWHIPLP